jgi:hypothetical protein
MWQACCFQDQKLVPATVALDVMPEIKVISESEPAGIVMALLPGCRIGSP